MQLEVFLDRDCTVRAKSFDDEIDAALDYLGEPPLTVADRKSLLSVCTIEEDDGVDIVEIINYVTVAKVKQMMNECYCNHTESLVSHEDCSQP